MTKISEVVGMEKDEIKVQDIFEFRKNGVTANREVNGEFVLYNYIPKVYKIMKERGINDIDDIFLDIEKTPLNKKEV